MGQSITLPLPACLLPIVLNDAISWPGTGCLRGQHLLAPSQPLSHVARYWVTTSSTFEKSWFLATLWGFPCWGLGFCYIVMADPYVIWTKWAKVGPVAIWCISAWEDVVYFYTLHLSRVWFILSFSPSCSLKFEQHLSMQLCHVA